MQILPKRDTKFAAGFLQAGKCIAALTAQVTACGLAQALLVHIGQGLGVDLCRDAAFAAIFTSDTIDAATKRHEARLVEMNVIFAQMYADAAKGSEVAKAAMTTAATTAEEIAKKLEAVRQGTQEAVGRGVEA